MKNKIIKALKILTKNKSKKLHEPIFKGNEKKYLKQCIDSGYVSYKGKFVDNLLEGEVKEFDDITNQWSIKNYKSGKLID